MDSCGTDDALVPVTDASTRASLPPVPDADEPDDVRERCNALVGSDAIDKSAALGILRLHHAMETRLLCMEFEKDKQVDYYKNELNVQCITHKQADMLTSLSADVSRLRGEMAELDKLSKDTASQLARVSEAVRELQGMLQEKRKR